MCARIDTQRPTPTSLEDIMSRTLRTPDHLCDGSLRDHRNRRRNTIERRTGTRAGVIARHLDEVA